MMRPRHATAILLAAAALAAGCTATSHASAARHGGGVSVRVAAAERRVHCYQYRQQHSVPLPAGFVADAAVRCVEALVTVHGQGREGWIEEQANRDLAPLIAAVRQPSAHPTPGTPIVCPLPYVAPLVLFLIDRQGQTAQPVIPTDGCGQPQQQVLAAVQSVLWVTVHAPRPTY